MNYQTAARQFGLKPTLLFVRFEQGRGRGGVPKTWVPFFEIAGVPLDVRTLVRMAVDSLRALCADPTGHGRDLMPNDVEQYALHNIDGGIVEKSEEIRWEQVDGVYRAELVLTWGLPSERLLAERDA